MRSAAAALAFAGCTLAAAQPVAFVADLQGNATVEGNGPVRFLMELSSGTRLLVATGGAVTVTYAASGTEFAARGPGEFSVGPTALSADKGVAPLRRSVPKLKDTTVVADATKTATASLRMRALRPEDRVIPRLVYPVETRVATLQPHLRYQAVGAGTVELRDAAGKLLWSGAAKGDSIRPLVRLAPAARYRWTIVTPQGTLPEATFETLPKEAIAQVEAAQSGRTFSDRVVHALLLQQLGANDEAREAWRALARERPDLPELAPLAP